MTIKDHPYKNKTCRCGLILRARKQMTTVTVLTGDHKKSPSILRMQNSTHLCQSCSSVGRLCQEIYHACALSDN